MKMLKVMEKRRSVREYKNKELSSKDLKKIQELLVNKVHLVDDVNVTMKFLHNGDDIYRRLNGVAGYSGVMIEAPHYVAIYSNKSEHYLKVAGYLTELFVLNATKLDVGTCWISVDGREEKIKDLLGTPTSDDLIAILSIGYPREAHRLSKIYDTMKSKSLSSLTQLGYPHIDSEYSESPVSGRMSIKDIVYVSEWGNQTTVEDLEKRGLAEVFFYMRLAPSWGNRQPWRFILDKEKIVLTISYDNQPESDKVELLEAGIAMLYFEIAMHGEGLPGKWDFESKVENTYSIPENYMVIGSYTF